MQLTPEQIAIINSTGNIKINAVAGSGKTTTMIEYAKVRPANSKILYLAFNKSVKLEAAKKFADAGLRNVIVETAHSLAYKHIVFQNNYTVRPQGYKTNEIAELLQLQGNGEKHTEYIVANHIAKFIAYFCNSDKEKVQDLHYLDTISDGKAETFVKTFYHYIESKTRLLLSRMDKGEIAITHDFYLKKFQLSQPKLYYDYILFDEGQDASAAMLDIFLKQAATKVIVGDTHQQIYGWRHAVNSLQKARFASFNLSVSFRFSQPVADLAMEILQLKKHIGKEENTRIVENGNNEVQTIKAVIARTNLGLLLKAIEYVTEKKQVERIYFEGNINSYTYADEGASLYDVLNLYNDKPHLIRDNLIKAMKDMDELEDYIDKTEEAQLGMMVEIVKEYGNKIPGIIKAIKDKHVEGDEKEKAEMIFSTVHRSKGMEYDAVQIVNDFISEAKIKKLKDDKEKIINTDKLNEEINLLYVAVTRTKNILYIPETLMPAGLQPSPHIQVMKVLSEEEKRKSVAQTKPITTIQQLKKKAFAAKKDEAYEQIRRNYKEAYNVWTVEQDEELMRMFDEGANLQDAATHFGRTKGAIRSRLKRLMPSDD